MTQRKLPQAGLQNLRGPEFRRFLKDLKSGAFNASPTFDSVTIDNISIDGNTISVSGALTIDGLIWPTADGTSGQVITTNGAGTLSFGTPAGFDLTGYTTDTAVGTTDYFLIHDGSHKKITRTNVEASLNHDNLSGFVANEHIDWTSSSSNFSTSGTVGTGALSVTGNITVSGTVDGRDVATDGTKLDGVESGADVTDETNVVAALDGATLTAVTVASDDKVIIQDTSDADNIKTVTASQLLSGAGGNAWSDPVDSSIIPDTDSTYDLGDGTHYFANAYIDAITTTGNISPGGTVDGRDVAADGSKLDGIESGADVTDETNVVSALDGATLTAVTVAATDKVLIQDASDSSNIKTVTASQLLPTLVPEYIYVYRNTSQTITTGTATKIQFDTEITDLASTFDSTTNYRHTPGTAGYYLYTTTLNMTDIKDGGRVIGYMRKNGSNIAFTKAYSSASTADPSVTMTIIASMNGSTDYLEVYIEHDHGSDRSLTGLSYVCYLQGYYLGPNS